MRVHVLIETKGNGDIGNVQVHTSLAVAEGEYIKKMSAFMNEHTMPAAYINVPVRIVEADYMNVRDMVDEPGTITLLVVDVVGQLLPVIKMLPSSDMDSFLFSQEDDVRPDDDK